MLVRELIVLSFSSLLQRVNIWIINTLFLESTNLLYLSFCKQSLFHESNKYFCRVVGGIETLDIVESQPLGKNELPIEPIVMNRIEVHVNPFDDYENAQLKPDVEEKVS